MSSSHGWDIKLIMTHISTNSSSTTFSKAGYNSCSVKWKDRQAVWEWRMEIWRRSSSITQDI